MIHKLYKYLRQRNIDVKFLELNTKSVILINRFDILTSRLLYDLLLSFSSNNNVFITQSRGNNCFYLEVI